MAEGGTKAAAPLGDEKTRMSRSATRTAPRFPKNESRSRSPTRRLPANAPQSPTRSGKTPTSPTRKNGIKSPVKNGGNEKIVLSAAIDPNKPSDALLDQLLNDTYLPDPVKISYKLDASSSSLVKKTSRSTKDATTSTARPKSATDEETQQQMESSTPLMKDDSSNKLSPVRRIIPDNFPIKPPPLAFDNDDSDATETISYKENEAEEAKPVLVKKLSSKKLVSKSSKEEAEEPKPVLLKTLSSKKLVSKSDKEGAEEPKPLLSKKSSRKKVAPQSENDEAEEPKPSLVKKSSRKKVVPQSAIGEMGEPKTLLSKKSSQNRSNSSPPKGRLGRSRSDSEADTSKSTLDTSSQNNSDKQSSPQKSRLGRSRSDDIVETDNSESIFYTTEQPGARKPSPPPPRTVLTQKPKHLRGRAESLLNHSLLGDSHGRLSMDMSDSIHVSLSDIVESEHSHQRRQNSFRATHPLPGERSKSAAPALRSLVQSESSNALDMGASISEFSGSTATRRRSSSAAHKRSSATAQRRSSSRGSKGGRSASTSPTTRQSQRSKSASPPGGRNGGSRSSSRDKKMRKSNSFRIEGESSKNSTSNKESTITTSEKRSRRAKRSDEKDSKKVKEKGKSKSPQRDRKKSRKRDKKSKSPRRNERSASKIQTEASEVTKKTSLKESAQTTSLNESAQTIQALKTVLKMANDDINKSVTSRRGSSRSPDRTTRTASFPRNTSRSLSRSRTRERDESASGAKLHRRPKSSSTSRTRSSSVARPPSKEPRKKSSSKSRARSTSVTSRTRPSSQESSRTSLSSSAQNQRASTSSAQNDDAPPTPKAEEKTTVAPPSGVSKRNSLTLANVFGHESEEILGAMNDASESSASQSAGGGDTVYQFDPSKEDSLTSFKRDSNSQNLNHSGVFKMESLSKSEQGGTVRGRYLPDTRDMCSKQTVVERKSRHKKSRSQPPRRKKKSHGSRDLDNKDDHKRSADRQGESLNLESVFNPNASDSRLNYDGHKSGRLNRGHESDLRRKERRNKKLEERLQEKASRRELDYDDDERSHYLPSNMTGNIRSTPTGPPRSSTTSRSRSSQSSTPNPRKSRSTSRNSKQRISKSSSYDETDEHDVPANVPVADDEDSEESEDEGEAEEEEDEDGKPLKKSKRKAAMKYLKGQLKGIKVKAKGDAGHNSSSVNNLEPAEDEVAESFKKARMAVGLKLKWLLNKKEKKEHQLLGGSGEIDCDF